jgi:hypothetical protein
VPTTSSGCPTRLSSWPTSQTGLRPGGFLALVWGATPTYDDDAPWQRALVAVTQRWRHRPGAEARIPVGWQADRDARPDQQILTEAGSELAGRHSVRPQPRLGSGRACRIRRLDAGSVGRGAG